MQRQSRRNILTGVMGTLAAALTGAPALAAISWVHPWPQKREPLTWFGDDRQREDWGIGFQRGDRFMNVDTCEHWACVQHKGGLVWIRLARP